jgi:hypothetical protein
LFIFVKNDAIYNINIKQGKRLVKMTIPIIDTIYYNTTITNRHHIARAEKLKLSLKRKTQIKTQSSPNEKGAICITGNTEKMNIRNIMA